MCGGVKTKWIDNFKVFNLKRGMVISGDMLRPSPKMELVLTDHRFMQYEKLQWWKSKIPQLALYRFPAISFFEQNKEFNIPYGYEMVCTVYDNNISFVTISPDINRSFDELDKLRIDVAKIHHRMPLLARIAA